MTITTAARRITRKVNEYRAGYRLGFDAEGRLVAAVYGPNGFLITNRSLRERVATVVAREEGRRLTQREAQEAIDWWAEQREAGGFLPA